MIPPAIRRISFVPVQLALALTVNSYLAGAGMLTSVEVAKR
jgi:hypothetical protein